MTKEEIEENGTCWYMLNGNPVLVQKLLKQCKYYTFGGSNSGWYILTDDIIEKLIYCDLPGYNKEKK